VNARASAALLALLVLAGCASDDPSTVDITTSTTAAPSATTSAPVTPSTGTTPRSGPTTRRTIIVGGTDAVPGPARPDVASGSPGEGAARLLRPGATARLQVEIQAQPGAQPPQQVLDHLRRELADASGKPVEVTSGGVPPDRDVWTGAQLRSTAVAGARPTAPDTGTVHLLYLHGRSENGDDTLGLSVASDVAAVFPDRVAEAAVGLASASTLTDAVSVHELGHLLGLVDLVLHTGRQDPDHPGHSRNSGSVMYWAVESSLVGDLLTGGPPREFDAQDRADLATIRRG
jgi:hypothetical protein